MLLRADGVDLARRYHLWDRSQRVYFPSVRTKSVAENQQRLVGNGFGDQPHHELENSHKDFLSPAVGLRAAASVWRVELPRDSLRWVQRSHQGGLPVQPQPGERDQDQLRQRRLSRRLPRPTLQILHPGDLTFHNVQNFLDRFEFAGVQSEARGVAVVASSDLHGERHPPQTCRLQPQLHAAARREALWRWINLLFSLVRSISHENEGAEEGRVKLWIW